MSSTTMGFQQTSETVHSVVSAPTSSSKRVFALCFAGTVFIFITVISSKQFISKWDYRIRYSLSSTDETTVTERPGTTTKSTDSQVRNISSYELKGKYESYFSKEPLQLHCSSCAYISSSGHMLHSNLGEEIDSYECVFRSNDSPTTGYETDVGIKTTVRTLDLRSLQFVMKRLLSEEKLFDKNFFNETFIVGYFWGSLPQTILNYFKKYPDFKLYRFNPKQMVNIGKKFRTELGEDGKNHIWISSGFYTLILASDICDVIHVYGMPDADYCRRSMENDPTAKAVSYHYYGNVGDECKIYYKFDEKKESTHRFTNEKKAFENWARGGVNLHFHNPDWPGFDAA